MTGRNPRFGAIRRKDGSVKLYERRRPASIHHSPARGPRVKCPLELLDMWINKETGNAVTLLEQTANHTVIYDDGSGEPKTVSDNAFFTAHREPTADEIAAASGGKAKKSA